MSSGSDGVLYGRCEEGGAQPGGDAGRAGDEVDGEPGDGVPQRLHRIRGEPLPGPAAGAGRGAGSAACDTPGRTGGRLIVRARVAVIVIAVAGRVGAVQGDARRGQRERDDRVDHPHVGVPGDHRLGDRVAGGRLRVLPGQVARLAGRAAQPHLLGLRRAGTLAQLGNGMCTATWVSAPARSGTIFAPISSSQPCCSASWNRCPSVRRSSGPAFLPSASKHGLDGGGAFRGQVPADHAGAAERGAGLHVPVVEPVVVGVGPRGAPLFQGDAGDGPQVIQRGPGLSGLHQDLDRLGAQLGGQLLGPVGDRQRPGPGDVRGGEGGGHVGVVAQQPHLPHLGPGVAAGHAGHRHQPRGGVAVPVSVMRVGGVEPGQHRGVRGGELRLHLRQRPQHRPARGRVQVGRIRAVQVVHGGVRHPQRLRDTAEHPAVCGAHPEPPPG